MQEGRPSVRHCGGQVSGSQNFRTETRYMIDLQGVYFPEEPPPPVSLFFRPPAIPFRGLAI